MNVRLRIVQSLPAVAFAASGVLRTTEFREQLGSLDADVVVPPDPDLKAPPGGRVHRRATCWRRRTTSRPWHGS
ncbi:hypothetical protein ACFV23_42625 [Streptomyces sp. NPDC059627]